MTFFFLCLCLPLRFDLTWLVHQRSTSEPQQKQTPTHDKNHFISCHALPPQQTFCGTKKKKNNNNNKKQGLLCSCRVRLRVQKLHPPCLLRHHHGRPQHDATNNPPRGEDGIPATHAHVSCLRSGLGRLLVATVRAAPSQDGGTGAVQSAHQTTASSSSAAKTVEAHPIRHGHGVGVSMSTKQHSKAEQSKAKQSKAKQSKAKQSKAKHRIDRSIYSECTHSPTQRTNEMHVRLQYTWTVPVPVLCRSTRVL